MDMYIYIYISVVRMLSEHHWGKHVKRLSVTDACASMCAFDEQQAHSRICSITFAVRAWKISRIKLSNYDSWLSLGAPSSAPSSIDLQSIQWVFLHLQVPSLKLTWHLKITPWKRRFLLKTIIFRGYVSFRECNYPATPSQAQPRACAYPSKWQKGHVRLCLIGVQSPTEL